jgi:HSP20 family protein
MFGRFDRDQDGRTIRPGLESGAWTRKWGVGAAAGPRGPSPQSAHPTQVKGDAMSNLTAYDPFAETGFDEMFRGFFRPVRAERAPVSIKMDVTEKDNAYVVKAEIPGVAKEDIQVSIDGNQVTIGAELKRERDANDGERALRSERHYGSLYRGFTLPVELDESASNAKYENGVLELTLAKKPASAGRKLTVQ